MGEYVKSKYDGPKPKVLPKYLLKSGPKLKCNLHINQNVKIMNE